MVAWLLGGAVALVLLNYVASGIILRVRKHLSAGARYKRLLERTKEAAIADIREGSVVKVVGRVVALGAPRTATLSGHPSVYALVRLDQPIGGLPLLQERFATSFVLEDASGRARIVAEQAHFDVPVSTTQYSGGIDDPPASQVMRALLARHGREPENHFRHIYNEARLSPGDPVAVYGLARRWEPDPEAPATYRDVSRRLVFEPTSAVPLIVGRPSA